MERRGDETAERGHRTVRVPAILLIATGVVLLAAAVSFGKGGPSISALQFAVDSSGTGPPPVTPPVQPGDRVAPRLVASPPNSFVKTRKRRPTFKFGSSESPATFYCKMGSRPAEPCTSPFRVPDLGFGRHVLWVMTVDAAGNGSPGVKFKYQVLKPRR